MSRSAPHPRRDPALPAVVLVGAVTLWRILELAFDAPNLSFDEAQYWAWAQQLQLGYYSKPPMVAWAIAATTALFGDGEGAVKLGSTLAHAGTALVLLALGGRLYDRATGAWAAALWITMPAVSLSAMMITTDPFLLFFWALALLCLLRAAEAGPAPNRWWIGLGLSFGLGLLSKYAMALFLPGLAAWMIWSAERRALMRAPGLWLAAAAGLAVYAPNALWNAANGFVSYRHTGDNANLAGPLFHPDKLAEFVGAQFGVFGPILMAALIAAVVAACRRSDDRTRLLVSFTLPVLLLMTVQALLSRANANWSAPAFVAATVLVAAFLRARAPALLWLSLGLHLAVAGVMYEVDAVRALAGYGHTAKLDPMKRIRAWDQVGERVSAHLAAHPGARLLADERKVLATLIYYVRPHPMDAVKWNPSGAVHDHYDQTTRLEPGEAEYIFVTEGNPDGTGVIERFRVAERLEDIRVPVHADYARAVTVWRLAGFKGY